MNRRGAGGTNGGELSFLLELFMIIGGGYLLLNSIIVRPQFGMGMRTFGNSVPVTSSMILIVFMFGVGFIFYDILLPPENPNFSALENRYINSQ